MKKPGAPAVKAKGQASIMGFFKKTGTNSTPSKAAGEESDGSPAASTEGPLEAKTKAGRVRKAVPADEDDDDMEVEADLGPPLRKEKNEDDDDDTKPAEAGEEAGGAEASVAAEPVADVAAVERRSKKKEDTRQAAAKDEVKGSGARKRVRKVVADEESEDEEDDKMMEVDEEKPKAEETSAKPKASPQGKRTKTQETPSQPAAAAAQPEAKMDVESNGEAASSTPAKAADDEEGGEDEEGEEEEEEEEGVKEEKPAASEGGKTATGVLMQGARSYSASSGKKGKNGKAKAVVLAASTRQVIDKIRALPDSYPSLPYKVLCDVFDAIENISGRLEITDIMRELFAKSLHSCPQDLSTVLYLACNRIAPAYEGLELGIGEGLLYKAIETATGRAVKDIKAAYQEEGDLGLIAQNSKARQATLAWGAAPKPLTIKEVLDGFREVARFSGDKSQERKVQHITKMLRRCCKDGFEAKYLIRGLQAKLRIGLAEKTVLVALAHAVVLHPPPSATEPAAAEDDQQEQKEEQDEEEQLDDSLLGYVKALTSKDRDARLEAAASLIKQAYSECPDYDNLSKVVLKAPLSHILRHSRLTPGIPVSPMLAKPEKSVKSILKRLSGLPFTMEFKYDGERAQVHKLENGEVRIFSRNSEDMTSKYPDLIASLPTAIRDSVTSFVMDAEVVAWDPVEKKLLPFQTLSTRKRKDEKAENVKVRVILQAFDLIFLNGKPLLRQPLRKRRELLLESFVAVEGQFAFAVSLDHREDGDTLPIETFLADAVQGNCEGLMIKTLDDTYEPIKRSLNWLKLKKDYVQDDEGGHGVADALDLVVIGAYHGKGKRTGWYGAFLLACYDPDLEEYQSVCKVGTGFSEERLAKFTAELKESVIPRKPSYYKVGETLDCDEWFDAKVVWEVKAADLSKSPVHMGAFGKVEAGKGIALRFPRFIRERDDKKPEDATTAEQVVDMYKSQELAEDSTKAGDDKDNDDDDGYL